MADEANIPTHRWYQNRNHIKLPMQDVSESVINAAGIAKIDQFMITAASDALFAAGEVGVWYDPSDLTTLFQDSAGTTPVTAAGQPVGLMLDKSGRGNHATQATAAQRPTYGIHPYSGVRNVANGSAAYDNATFWFTSSTANGITVAKVGNGIDFDGLSYVDYSVTGTALLDTTSGTYLNSLSRVSAASGQSFTSSFIARIVGGTAPPADNGVRADVIGETAPSAFIEASTSAVLAPTVDTLISVSRTLNNAATNQARGVISILTRPATTVNYTIRIKAVQFEKSATRTAYQANYSQYNITEAGVPSVHYIGSDGVDDGMVTNSITPATDKVQIFVGLRKVGTAQATLIEHSASFANNGTFALEGPNSGNDYAFVSGGTIPASALARGTGFAPPVTNVVTGLGDISSDLTVLRVNGTQVAQSSNDQGAGNYLAYPLYVGRRGGTSQPFNGNLYSLIVRFGPNLTTGQVTNTETWVNQKTGAY